ncbi:hypothetical protein CRYUN_Cryun16bG0066800 [Craigia yunnanensis]
MGGLRDSLSSSAEGWDLIEGLRLYLTYTLFQVIGFMGSNLQTSSPDGSDAKAAFCKPSNDASNRQYRRRSPVSSLSSSEGSSPQRDHSVSPMVSRDDLAKSADTRLGKDERELDRDSSRNQYSRNGDSYRYSDRQSSGSSHGYSRHDDYVRNDNRADEYSKYDRLSSRSGGESRVSTHSDHPRQESDLSRSKDYSQNSDKYSRNRYDGSGHRSRDKEKESPSLEHQKYKDKDSSTDRVGSGRRHVNSISERWIEIEEGGTEMVEMKKGTIIEVREIEKAIIQHLMKNPGAT